VYGQPRTVTNFLSYIGGAVQYKSYTTGTPPPRQLLSVAGNSSESLVDYSCDANAERPAAGYPQTTQGSGGMAKQSPDPEASPPSSWDVYRQAHKAIWLGIVVATDERDAIEKVAKERNIPANRLIATRRR
jgi:hypothetical protein